MTMLTANDIYQMVGDLNAELFDKNNGDRAEIIVDAYVCAIMSTLRGASGNDADTLKLNGEFLLEQIKHKLDHQVNEAITDTIGMTQH
jgi:hypothetical protein